MTNPMNCQSAHDLLQELLDERWASELPPELQDHLDHCEPCRCWQALFLSKPHPGQAIVPAGFASKVLQRHVQDRRHARWIRYSSLLSMAAALLATVMAWVVMTQPPAHHQLASHQPPPDSKQIIVTLKHDFDNLASRLPSLNVTLPSRLPSWDMLDLDDPLSASMPAIRTIGTTLQDAVEPYEAPARAAYQKVKSLVDDPEVKKLVDHVKKRWS